MKKRLFFGFAFFIGLFMLVAWQYAADELANLQMKNHTADEKELTEIV